MTETPVDVVVMEMLDTGLLAELQAPALNALRENGVIGPHTRVIPEPAALYAESIEYDFDGFAMPYVIQARNAGVEKPHSSPADPARPVSGRNRSCKMIVESCDEDKR